MLAAVVKRTFCLLMKNSFTTKGHIKDYDCMKKYFFVVVIRKPFIFLFLSLTIHQEISKLMPVFIRLYKIDVFNFYIFCSNNTCTCSILFMNLNQRFKHTFISEFCTWNFSRLFDFTPSRLQTMNYNTQMTLFSSPFIGHHYSHSTFQWRSSLSFLNISFTVQLGWQ